MILLKPSSMTFLSQGASKANCVRSSADLTGIGRINSKKHSNARLKALSAGYVELGDGMELTINNRELNN